MRGLKLIMSPEGQWGASNKTAIDGAEPKNHRRTWQLYDWISQVGPIQWKYKKVAHAHKQKLRFRGWIRVGECSENLLKDYQKYSWFDSVNSSIYLEICLVISWHPNKFRYLVVDFCYPNIVRIYKGISWVSWVSVTKVFVEQPLASPGSANNLWFWNIITCLARYVFVFLCQ